MPSHVDVSPSLFRELMGHFATGVTVITAPGEDGQPSGMTASSLTSVSLTPPLVSVCVARSAALHGLLERSPLYTLNVLSESQEELSRRFAGPKVAAFAGVGFHTNEHGMILLDGAMAHIECVREAAHPAGDHTILLGRVIGGRAYEGRPLLYFRGGYAGLG